MKFIKRAQNVSDDNDRMECRLKLSEIRIYVTNLKRYLNKERNNLVVGKCRAIEKEIEAWVGFFRMLEVLNLKSSNPKGKKATNNN